MNKKQPIAIILSVFIISLLVTDICFAQSELTIFGPKQYDKPKGKPVTYIDNFQANYTTGTYTLWVQSGAEGLNEIKNVSVSINGVEIIDSRDLRASNPVSKIISVKSINTISVTLKGQGGNYITAKILCNGCYPTTTGTISPAGGTIALEGYASVIFPAGAFTTSKNVTISATASPKTQEDFNVTAEGPRLPYEIRINSGLVAPATPIEIILNVPYSFITALPSNYEIRAYAQFHEPLDSPEIYDHFNDDLVSEFDSVAKTVRVILPADFFTNLRYLDNTYEAIIIIGVTSK